jgi:hypothetical protein
MAASTLRARRIPGEVLEGAAPDVTNITMIEFPSMERELHGHRLF